MANKTDKPKSWPLNNFPIPHHQWREAEDRASKYQQLYDLSRQENERLKAEIERMARDGK